MMDLVLSATLDDGFGAVVSEKRFGNDFDQI
jgi:hypothetical protein